jgi:hypothetical protein
MDPLLRRALEEAEVAARATLAGCPGPPPENPHVNVAYRAAQIAWLRRHLPAVKRFADLLEQIHETAEFEQWYRRYFAAVFGTTLKDVGPDELS